MKGTEKSMLKRTKKVTFRMTEQEHAHLKHQISISNLNMEAFIRTVLAGENVTPRSPEQWVEILRELQKIGNNINQIARIANITERVTPEEIEKIQQMQSDIWRKVKYV